MNLKQIAQKLGGYIQSKTQDDEGLIRRGQFTPFAPIDDKIKSTVSNIRIGSGPTLGQAFNQVTSRGTQAFNPYQGIAENKSNNAFLRGGADIVNQGLKSFTNMSTLGLVQPKMGERQTKAGLIGSIGGGFAGFAVNPLGKVMGSTDTLVSKLAPKSVGLTSKVLKGLSSEALQTLGYSGASLLGSKLGLNEQKGQFTPNSLAQDFIMGSVLRGAGGAISLKGVGAKVKGMSPQVFTSDKTILNEAKQKLRVGIEIDQFSKLGKDLENMYKQYGLASFPDWNKLSIDKKVNILDDRLSEMARQWGDKVTMGIKDQSSPIKTGGDESQIKNIQDELIKLKTEQSKIQTENQINANSLNEMGSPMTKDQINRSNLIQDKIDKLQSQISPESVSKTQLKGIDWFDSNKISVAHRDGNQLYVRDILTDKSPEVYKKAGNIPIIFTYSNEKSVAGQPFMARLVAEPSTGRQVIEINKFYQYKNDVPKVLDKTIAEEIEHSLNFSGNPKMFENVYQGGNLSRYRNDPVERAANANLNKRFVGNVSNNGVSMFSTKPPAPNITNLSNSGTPVKNTLTGHSTIIPSNLLPERVSPIKTGTKIPTYSEASDLIQKEGGFANLKSLPTTNRYAAEQIGGSLGLNPKYLYEEATKKGINLDDYLKRIDAEVNPNTKIEIGNELISNLSPESKGTIKLKDNDLVKTFDKTIKTTESPKVKVSSMAIEQPELRQRGFSVSVQEAPNVSKKVKTQVLGGYESKPNDVLMGEAKALLNEGVDLKNINRIENIDQKIAATIQEAINLDAAGKHEEAAALFNNLSELGTQVGRGTQAFSLLNKMSPEAISLSVAGKIKKYNLSHNKKLPELTGEQQKQLSKQVNEALKFAPGTKERGVAIGRVNETINSFIPSTFADKFITVWKAGLLSSLRTHERNIVGNVIMQGSEQASLYPAAGADYLMSLATGKRSLVASQKGSLKGAIEGGQTAADVLKYGFDPSGTEIGKYETKKVTWGNNPLEQNLKKVTDIVFNTLEAEDKVFWKSSYNRSLYNQAITQSVNEGKRGNTKYIQKLFDNATEEMKQTAFNDANYATFKDKNMLSGAIGQYKSWVNRQTGPAAEAGKIVSEMLMPFTGVPTSIVGKTVAYSPIGLVKGSVDFGRVVAGSEVPGLQRQAAQEIGRGVIGSGIFGLGAYLMSKGLMTGQAKDQKERDQWALEGKQENSIFVNGKWRSINSVGPQTLVLLAGAKANETANDPEQNLGTYGFSTLNDQLNQTFLSGVQQPLAALNEPYKAKSYLGGQVSSLIPNIVKDTSKAFDPLKREVDTSTIGSSIKGRVQQSIPFARNKMIPQRDVLGNEIAQTPTGIGAYFDLFNSTTPISNTVVNELSRLNTAGYNKTPTKLDKNQTIGGEKMTLNQAQLDRLEIVSGLATDKALNDLFNTTAYQSLNDAEKQDAIGDTITKVRKNVRANIDLSNIQEKSYVKSSDSQLTELGGFNLFTKSVTTDPKAAMNALLTGNPIRKISDGNIVVLERENDVGSYDLGDTTSQVDHAIPLSLGGTNEVRNLQILSNEEHAIKTKTDMYLLYQVQSGKMPLKEAQEKAKNWRDTALSLPSNVQSQMIDEVDSESADKQSDGSQVYKLVSDTGNVTLVDLGTPIKQPEYTGFDAIDKKLKSSYKSAITKRINNIVKLYEDGRLSAKEANKLIGELNTQYSSGTGTQKKSKKKITFKVTSPKALPKITLKISSPVSRVKLKSAPKIKLSKTDNRKYTIKA